MRLELNIPFLEGSITIDEYQYYHHLLPFMALLQFQLTRRAFECITIHKFSERRLELINSLFAFCFYLLISLGPVVESLRDSNAPEVIPTFHINRISLIAAAMFLLASYHQHVCHKILSNLRNDAKSSQRYGIPYGDWFEWVSSPHYFAEILIYITFLIVVGLNNMSMWLALMFVVLNLTHSAYKTHNWYLEKFKEAYPKQRKFLLPLLL